MTESRVRRGSIALVDVNCFYASAERAFDPSLEGRPVVVLCARLDSVRDRGRSEDLQVAPSSGNGEDGVGRTRPLARCTTRAG